MTTLGDKLSDDFAMCRRHSTQQNLGELWWLLFGMTAMLRTLGDERARALGVLALEDVARVTAEAAHRLGLDLHDPELPSTRLRAMPRQDVVRWAGLQYAMVAIRLQALLGDLDLDRLDHDVCVRFERAAQAVLALVEPEAA